MKLSEVFNRNDQLKAAFTQALEDTIAKHAKHFDGDAADKVRAALITKFDVNRNKSQITTILSDLGVGNSNEVAQFLLTQTNKLDK